MQIGDLITWSNPNNFDYCISFGSTLANDLGFTTEKYSGYLWKAGNWIYISLIETRKEHQGYLRNLFDNIHNAGYNIYIPCPNCRMTKIALQYGFIYDKRHRLIFYK